MFLIFGLFGIIADPFYCIDYWRPITLTGNSVSLEPILLGGSFGGTASVIYQILFRKRSKVYETDTKKIKQNKLLFFSLVVIIPLLMLLFSKIFFINTFISTILASVVSLLIIFLYRKNLILPAIISGLIMVLISGIIYKIVDLLTPGWVNAFWLFQNTPNIIILGLPIDDVFWYFLIGGQIAVLYELWKGRKYY